MPKPTLSAPDWQSRALQIGALVALVAVEVSATAYAYQSASRAQILDLGWVQIPTDVVLKSMMSIAAGLSVVIGPSIALHLWRAGGKRSRRQAIGALVASLVGLTISTGNLSGYSAWTRDQRSVEVTTANPLYALAVSAARHAAANPDTVYGISSRDRAMLEQGQARTTAERDAGDVFKALSILLLVSGMATAYRLPTPRIEQRQKRGRKAKKLADTTNVTTLPAASQR